jgi:hypothetical protein
MWVQCQVAGRVVKVPAEEVGWASLQDVVARPDCPLTKNSLKEVERWLIDLSTMSNRCTYVSYSYGIKYYETLIMRIMLRQSKRKPCSAVFSFHEYSCHKASNIQSWHFCP